MFRPIRNAGLALAMLVTAGPALSTPGEQQVPPRPPSAVPATNRPPGNVAVQVAGSSLFLSYCAACHGASARGDGPLADQLRVRPPDLTLLARRAKGSFDKEKVRRIVDGRDPVKGHGGPDMPVWGDAFKSADEGYSEQKAAQRIVALVDYLEDIQQKP